MTHQLFESAPGQGTNRIEGDVAEQLHPDLVAKPRGDGASETGRDQRFSELLRAFRLRAVRLAKAQAIALDMADDAGLDDVGREVCKRANDAPRLDRCRDDAAGIDP